MLPGIRGYSRISARAFSLFNTSPHSCSFQQMARDRGKALGVAQKRAILPFYPDTYTPPSLFQPLYVLVRGWLRYSFIHGYSQQHDSFAARLEPYRIRSSDQDKSSSFLHLYLLDLFAICRRRRNCEVLTSSNMYFLWFQYRKDGFAVGVRYFSSWILMLELWKESFMVGVENRCLRL